MSSPVAATGWSAELRLDFVARTGRTVLERRAHQGPLVVQRPFTPEGPDLLHVYLLHPPGGIVAGDVLSTQVRLGRGSRVLFTTPAAAKVYRGRPGAGSSRQWQDLRAGPGCSLEWLPQETIVFDGADVALGSVAHLEADAAFIGWEVLCFGRPAMGERYARGVCRQHFEIWRDGRPLCLERMRVEASGALASATWGLGGRPISGTFLASPSAATTMDLLRARCADLPAGDLAAVTELDGVLLARYLGGSTERCRRLFIELWTVLRPPLLGRPADRPRVWAT
jgi:urease accessory protein